MKNIEFWFSIGSTYTYLSVIRILDVEKKHEVKFSWKPFSVRKIMKEMVNVPFPPNKKNKVNYMWRDIERRAKFYGFFANVPVSYPLTEFDLANKIAILGLKEDWGIEYTRLTYKRWFQEGKEPAVEPNISEIFKLLNLDHEKIMNEANAEPINNIYEANTNLARQKKYLVAPLLYMKMKTFGEMIEWKIQSNGLKTNILFNWFPKIKT